MEDEWRIEMGMKLFQFSTITFGFIAKLELSPLKNIQIVFVITKSK